MQRRLNILILHAIDDFARIRQSTLRHILALQRYAPQHRYYYQNIRAHATPHLQAIPFDLIVLDASFLCWRWVRPRHHFEEAKARYGWLAASDAVKAAFPQDDYDHAAILDDWLADYRVQMIYSICAEHHDILYPRNHRRAVIKSVLTGYIDADDIALYGGYRRPFAERFYDAGYRVRALPPWFGSFGLLKSDFGRAFAKAADGVLRFSISDRPEATLTGKEWPNFLGDCRYALGSEGGSDIIDADGSKREACEIFMKKNPRAAPRDVIAAVLPDDGQYVFAMPTPRLFEIAMAGCCPILLEGDYFGWLTPELHYLAVRRDFSNIPDLIARLDDHEAAQSMARRFHDALLTRPELHYDRHVAGLFADVAPMLGPRATGQLDDSQFAAAIAAHHHEAQKRLGHDAPMFPHLLKQPPPPVTKTVNKHQDSGYNPASQTRRTVDAA